LREHKKTLAAVATLKGALLEVAVAETTKSTAATTAGAAEVAKVVTKRSE
jgi:hypothetical protein